MLSDTVFVYPKSQYDPIVFKPNSEIGKDALIKSSNMNVNYGAVHYHNIYSTPYSYSIRSLIYFDIPEICENNHISNENIISSKIHLYENDFYSNGFYGQSHLAYTVTELCKITSHWDEISVTYANQPTFDTQTSQVDTPFQNSIKSPYFDITEFAKEINTTPEINHGFLLKVKDENLEYGRGVFASSDHSSDSLHPELIIYYSGFPYNTGLPFGVFQCPGDTITLTAIEGYVSYDWSTGETGKEIQVYDTGQYTLSYTDFNGNVYDHTVNVYSEGYPLQETIDTVFEIGTYINLDPGDDFDSYSWSDNTFEQEKLIFNNEDLQVQLITENGCTISKEYHALLKQTIELSAGWSMISTCIDPVHANIDSIFAELNSLIILKNQMGLTYLPAYEINQIGNHTLGQGYLVKMELSENLEIVGSSISPENIPINLSSGWNMIAFLHHQPVSIEFALSGIIADIELIKNDLGQLYWQSFGIYTLSELLPTEGYQIKINSNQVFTYPNFCSGSFIDARDGQNYNMTQIGNQCWMAENLNVGEWILSNNPGQSTNQIIEKYCYADNSINCENYGGLYKWDEVMQNSTQESSQGICPDGWHIPSDNEWYVLENFVDPAINDPTIEGWRGISAGTILGNGGSAHFEAIGKGFFYTSYNDPNSTYMLSSSENTPSIYYFRQQSSNFTKFYRGQTLKDAALSVRCIRD
jgi:uncharacterized protein (TIGR02145 family)